MAAPTHWIVQPVNAAVTTNIAFHNPQKRVARIVSAFSVNAGNNPGTTARAAQNFAPVAAFSTAAADQILLVDSGHFQYNVAGSGYALTTGYDVIFIEVQYEGEEPGTAGS